MISTTEIGDAAAITGSAGPWPQIAEIKIKRIIRYRQQILPSEELKNARLCRLGNLYCQLAGNHDEAELSRLCRFGRICRLNLHGHGSQICSLRRYHQTDENLDP